mgnify:CR=1 FL=1
MSGKMGSGVKRVWVFLDGKKTFLWLGVTVIQLKFPNLPFWGFINAAAHQIGWDTAVPGVDAGQLVDVLTLAIALGHKLAKAWKDSDMELKWETIGQIPSLKKIDAPIAPSNATPALVDYRSKDVLLVGARVQLPNGKSGVVFVTKENSSTGFTYGVKEL